MIRSQSLVLGAGIGIIVPSYLIPLQALHSVCSSQCKSCSLRYSASGKYLKRDSISCYGCGRYKQGVVGWNLGEIIGQYSGTEILVVLGGFVGNRRGGYPCSSSLATRTRENLESRNRKRLS